MIQHLRLSDRFAVLALGIAVALLPVAGKGESNDLAPGVTILLLNNGNLLTGHVRREGDHYLMATDSGQLRVRASDVAAECGTLLDAYEHRRQRVQPGVIDDHLELVNWCIRHRLFREADEQLQLAKQVDPTHPRLSLLERRLEVSQRAASAPPAASAAPTRQMPAAVELEQMIRAMPPGSVGYFANRIQPLLVNSCATAACHGPDSTSSFQLWRTPTHRPPSRRVTQRNLYHVLNQIDYESPSDSPLLTVPVAPHGPRELVLFPNPQAQSYRQLADWIRLVTAGPQVAQPATLPVDRNRTAPSVSPFAIEPNTSDADALMREIDALDSQFPTLPSARPTAQRTPPRDRIARPPAIQQRGASLPNVGPALPPSAASETSKSTGDAD